MFQALSNTLSSWDQALFFAVNRGTENRAFDILMPFITSFGNFKYLLAALLAFMLFYNGKTRAVAIVAVVAIILSDQTGNILKDLIERPRPCRVLHDVHLLVGCSGSGSFPSNHSANCFAVALTIFMKYRKTTAWAFAIAALVAFSRVYVGVHYPFDVIGGALLGLACGAIAVACSRWYEPRIEHLLERFTCRSSWEKPR